MCRCLALSAEHYRGTEHLDVVAPLLYRAKRRQVTNTTIGDALNERLVDVAVWHGEGPIEEWHDHRAWHVKSSSTVALGEQLDCLDEAPLPIAPAGRRKCGRQRFSEHPPAGEAM